LAGRLGCKAIQERRQFSHLVWVGTLSISCGVVSTCSDLNMPGSAAGRVIPRRDLRMGGF
jgi:hypothetical protein